jgi:hypothetical protein
MIHLIRLLPIVLVILASLSGSTGSEQPVIPDIPKYVMPEETLRGVKSVKVLIESLNDDAKGGGLVEETLQTDVELKLRTAGIRVYDKKLIPDPKDWDEFEKWFNDYSPHVTLYVNLNVKKISDIPMYAMAIDVDVHEDGVLTRGSQKIETMVSTWNTGCVVTVGANNFREGARNSVIDLVDMFINAYLKMNPK